MNVKVFHQLSYGMYVVCSKKGDQVNGQIANTVFQITSKPATIAVSINKENLTHDYITNSKLVTVSVLTEETEMSLIGTFGYQSGRDIDKFSGIKEFQLSENGIPVIKKNVSAWLEAKIIDSLDVGTHTLFIGEILDGEIINTDSPMSYAYYHQVKGGKSPKKAPTYIPEEELEEQPVNSSDSIELGKYQCLICGYVYDPSEPDHHGVPFDELPDNWVCPICAADKANFKKL